MCLSGRFCMSLMQQYSRSWKKGKRWTLIFLIYKSLGSKEYPSRQGTARYITVIYTFLFFPFYFLPSYPVALARIQDRNQIPRWFYTLKQILPENVSWRWSFWGWTCFPWFDYSYHQRKRLLFPTLTFHHEIKFSTLDSLFQAFLFKQNIEKVKL